MKAMTWSLWLLVACLGNLLAQSSQWELTQEDLDKAIRGCDTVVEGKLQNKDAGQVKIRVSEVLQGPQKMASLLLPVTDEQATRLNNESMFLFFLNRSKDKYQLAAPLAFLRGDLFLSDRVRKAALRWRIERCSAVVLATVSDIKEEEMADKSLQVTAQCKSMQTCKGIAPAAFIVRYQRIPKAVPPMVILFQDLTYLFFLNAGKEQGNYELINPYEGAYPERRSFVEEVKLLTRSDIPLDQEAGKEQQGIKLFAQMPENLGANEPAAARLLLQNVSGGELELYQQQLAAFILVHVYKEDGKPLPCKKTDVPAIPALEVSHFVKLAAEEYVVLPDLDVRASYELSAGKYLIYVQVKLPEQYAGKQLGKNGWCGQVTSNKIELQVTE